MMEKTRKSLFRFEFDKRWKLLAGIRKTEAVLTDLPTETEWAAMFPKGPTLEKARSTLESNQKELYEDLKKEAETVGEIKPRSVYPASLPPTRKRTLTRKLKGIFADSPCPPPSTEHLYIPPADMDTHSGSGPEGNAWHISYLRYPDNSAWNFIMWVRDNNDPFNKDVTVGFMHVSIFYELPSRPFSARYDVDINGGIDLGITSRSNHIFGTRWWLGWVNGGLGFEGEVYQLPTASLPIYGVKEWNANDWSYREDTLINRSIVLEPNQSIVAELGYILCIAIDRGVATATGWYWASAPGLTGSPPPDMRCIITPEY